MADALKKPLTGHFRADGRPLSLKEYEARGGYAALRKVLFGMTPAEVIQTLLDAQLAGRGGAGFPAGRKWSFVPTEPDWPRPMFVVCNADEMEPGTFKDRVLIQGNPHQLLEGMAISAYAVGAAVAYVFVRAEYSMPAAQLRKATAEAQAAGYFGENILGSEFSLDLRLHMSAGRYICGEASAMLNALEGERPVPRYKPPRQTGSGLWSKPTLVNNVETLCFVPPILSNGADWFHSLSLSNEGGTKLYTVSGRVRRPGAWELPMGTPIRELIERHAEGMHHGLRVRAVLPGGASTGFVLEKDLDTPMDDVSLKKVGSRLGTGTVIVLDDRTCPVGMLRNLEQFYAQESCGWCTPCWQGLHWVQLLLGAIEAGRGTSADLELLKWHTDMIKPGHTFCDLATGAMEPLATGLRYFENDLLRHIDEGRCPYAAGSAELG
jgi:NADH-quinone oxidoreductase subunit F